MFGLFDIVVQEYDYLEDVVFGLFDIVVQEYDYLEDVVSLGNFVFEGGRAIFRVGVFQDHIFSETYMIPLRPVKISGHV